MRHNGTHRAATQEREQYVTHPVGARHPKRWEGQRVFRTPSDAPGRDAVVGSAQDPTASARLAEIQSGTVSRDIIDGSAFGLAANTGTALAAFAQAANGTSNLTPLRLAPAASVAGKLTKTDIVSIAAPAARKRGSDGRVGLLTLTALMLSAEHESQAAFVEDGTIGPTDLKFGPLEIVTKEAAPRTIIHDNPGETLVLHRAGSAVSVSRITHSPEQMAALQQFYHQTDQMGQPNHQPNNGPGTSGTAPTNQAPVDFQLAPLPINNVLPGGIGTPVTPTLNSSATFVPLTPVTAPLATVPTIAISAIAITTPGNGAAVVNANQANVGVPVNGTTTGVENGQVVTLTILDGFDQVIYRGTAQVINGTWSVDISAADAKALADGTYRVTASVLDAAGHPAPEASTPVTIDTTAVPPTPALASDSGGSASDHITNSAALTLAGIEAGATVEYSSDGGNTWSGSFFALEGANTVQVRQTDVAGNVSSAATFAFTLDSVSPAAPGLRLTLDSGSFATDHITNSGALILSGVDAGTIIEYSSDGGSTWSGSFSAREGANTIQVRQTDVAGNVSSTTTLGFTLDTATAVPGVALASDNGSSGTDRITNNGALTLAGVEAGATVAYSIDGGNTWSSSFFALEGANTVQVRQTDVAGNVSSAATFAFTLDTVKPTVSVNIVDASLNDGDSSSQVTFTFSEAPVGFTAADITAAGGTVSGLAATADPLVYTAIFTATDTFSGTGSVSLAAGSYTDAAGNSGGEGSDTVTIDRLNPTVSVNIVDASLNDGDSSSQVTFTFSEAPVGFTAADITAAGGTVSGLAATADPLVYTAIFTANDHFDGTGAVSVATGSYSDAAGNAGTGGSDSTAIDRDEVPTAHPDSNSGPEASSSGKSVNIVIIFDRSGSMGDDPNVNGFSERIDLARAAVANLLTGLDGSATEVHVQVVDFATSAASSGWLSIDGANAYLAGLVASGSTNYDAALTTAKAAFVTGTPAADQNIALFLSDGVPTAGQEIGETDRGLWESFLTDHDMPSFAIGIGSGVTTEPLLPIAFDPEPGTQAADTPVVYGTGGEGALINALSPLVIGSLLNSFSGDLLLNDQFGGDGAGVPEISAVSYASVSGSSLAFTVTSAPDPLAPDVTQLTGSHDGVDYWRLDVNTATGGYDLSLLQNFPHATPGGTATLTFNYTIHDFDGDSSSSTLAVAIGDVTTATIAGLSQIAGGNTADTLNGTGAAEILGGDADNDILNGNGGDDFVFGGAGTDTLTGGTGNDTLYGGAGNDTYKFDLGDGTDTISDTGGTDTIVIQTGSAALSGLNFQRDGNNLVIDYDSDTITVTNHFAGASVEQIQFSGIGGSVYGYSLVTGTGTYLMDVDLTGSGNADVIAGTVNAETLSGNGGNDLLFGNGGNDVTINGNLGNDLLVGGAGNDTMDGGADNDWLVGGLGADSLTGGSGNDTFVYTAVDDSRSSLFDTITDFTSGDKIDLTAFSAASFSNVTWGYTTLSNETIVQVDTDGNAATAGLEIHLTGNIPLTQSQFIFV
jgi:hypothetical protein